jgi:hypothetical protein
MEIASQDVESFQIALNLIGNFSLSAQESKVPDIPLELKSLHDEIVSNC